MKFRVMLPALLGAALAAGAVGRANAVTLADLISTNGTIVNGDKTFSNFSYVKTGDMPDASGVNVLPVTIAGNLGIEFQGGFNSLPGDVSDALIKYVVTASGGNLITDAHIGGNPAVVGGTGALTITESFTPDAPNTMSIFDIKPGATKVTDSTDFAVGHSSLDVQKDILGIGGTGVATLSFVDQTYSQNTPEPGACALFAGSALAGLMMLRRRKAA